MNRRQDADRAAVEIVDYQSRHAEAWRALNEAWLAAGGFTIEAKDERVLSDPQTAIIAPGGRIFMAEKDGDVVGCCALMPMADGGLEVAKMTVSPQARGAGLGVRLLEACEAAARAMGAHRLYLETNSRLAPALRLYAGFGFAELPAQPSPYARVDVWMEKRL